MTDSMIQQVLPKIVDRLEQIVSRQQIPGLAIGIVHDQQLVWSQGFGAADLETGRPPDKNTISRVASITKTFTATAVLQLRDDGLLSLDDPLVKHIPEFSQVRVRAGALEGVTLRRLLSHRSGLVTESPFPCWETLEFPTREAMLAALPKTELVIPQDSAFKYSNLAFGLLGEVVARLSNRSYVDYMHAEILNPLGLSSSVFDLTDALRPRSAVGYARRPYEDTFSRAPKSPLNGIGPCGQLHSSVADLAKWISLQFRTKNVDRGEAQVLQGTTLEEMHRPQYLEPDWSFGYCLGWRARRVGNHVYHEHGGGIHGFSSQVMFCKPSKIGVIALANIWPHTNLYEIPIGVLETILAAKGSEVGPAVTSSTAVPPELNKFLGSYRASPSIPVNIVYQNDSLQFEHCHPGDYSLHAPALLETTDEDNVLIVRGGRGSGERAIFDLAEDGAIASFMLGGFLYRKLRPAEVK